MAKGPLEFTASIVVMLAAPQCTHCPKYITGRLIGEPTPEQPDKFGDYFSPIAVRLEALLGSCRTEGALGRPSTAVRSFGDCEFESVYESVSYSI